MKIERRTVEFKPRSRNLFFHILTRCNLRCRHCYINPDQHGLEILDEETVTRWLSILSGKGISACRDTTGAREAAAPAGETNVIFLGGEPTLNPALPAAVRAARRLGCASVTVDTNGFLFHDILEKVSPGEVDYFSFSLDGASPEVNDPIRGDGVFEVCTRGIRKAAEKGFGISSIFTASRINLHDLGNMPSLLKDLGVTRFFIQVIGIRGKPASRGETDLQLSREEWNEIVPEVAVRAAGMGLHVTYPKVSLESHEKFQCAGLVADNYFVFPNGRVYRCPLCEDYPLHSLEIAKDALRLRPPVTELDLYGLTIPEGCVLNRILHPGNIDYDSRGRPENRIACCMLKEEVCPGR